MPRTLAEIKKDFQSYKAINKRQRGVTLFAEKYVEDIGYLLDLLKPAPGETFTPTTKPTVRSSKAKAPKTE